MSVDSQLFRIDPVTRESKATDEVDLSALKSFVETLTPIEDEFQEEGNEEDA